MPEDVNEVMVLLCWRRFHRDMCAGFHDGGRFLTNNYRCASRAAKGKRRCPSADLCSDLLHNWLGRTASIVGALKWDGREMRW